MDRIVTRPVGKGIEFPSLPVEPDEVVYEIEVFPGEDETRPALDFMHRPDIFADVDGIPYEILQARQSRHRRAPYFGGPDVTFIHHVYLARRYLARR